MNITFTEIKNTGKTIVLKLTCNEHKLGFIKWFPHWRRYCFFPAPAVLFDASCLLEITEKIKELMDQRIININ